MKPYLVIDGYNLLYELVGESEINRTGLEEQRDKLIERIANYSALIGTETELVFDAWTREGQTSRERISGINLVYTGKDETADTYIERFIYNLPRLARVILITGDSGIQNMALLTGAERISSREFIGLMVEQEKDHIRYGLEKNAREGNILGAHLKEDYKHLFEKIRRGEDE